MSYTTVRDGIETTLLTVSGVQNVYDYLRYAATLEERNDKFVDDTNNRLHTWMITRQSAPSRGALDGDVTRSHIFHVHGYYEVEDANASERTFQELVETAMQTFNDNRTINSAAHIMDSAQLLVFENVMFSGVLCHHAVIELTVEDDVDP